jgi:hypothetical protein
MKIKPKSYFLRSHLLKMTMLSQRAVDYSIKAHQLGASEVSQLFVNYDREWRDLHCRIGDRGRRLSASGLLIDADSIIADGALRIYSALYVIYTAACEIAHLGSLMVEYERTSESPRLAEIARFINSLVRLCAVALFTRDVQHAKMVLDDRRGWQGCELALCRTRRLLMQNTSPQAGLELAFARALGQIAAQAYELAEASNLSALPWASPR